MRIVLLVGGLVAILMGKSMAAPPVKVEVCHFDEEAGAWVKIRIPEQAAAKHMEKHDDALPGGATAETATQLDADCAAAAGDAG